MSSTPRSSKHPVDTELRGLGSPGKGLLAGLGVGLACALACAVPVVLGAGVFAGAGAFLQGSKGVGVLVLALVAAGGAGWLVRRRRATGSDAGGCSCGGC